MVGVDRSDVTSGGPAARLPAIVFIAAVWLCLGVAPLAAQARVGGEIDALNTLAWDGAEEELGLVGYGSGVIDLRSDRDRNVQARLTLKAILGSILDPLTGRSLSASVLSVPRASIRFRFPVTEGYTVRVTAGRDRVSWGSGRLFNAADVIFGADGTGAADFLEISDDLRDETTWLTAIYFPLGDFAYFEPIVLPPLPGLEFAAAAGGAESVEGVDDDEAAGAIVAETAVPGIDRTRAGGRLSFEAGRFTFEPGYLYDGPTERHEAVLSVSGLIGVDVYGAGRISLDGAIDPDNAWERTTFSVGGYNHFRLGYDTTLDARLEALIRPGAEWEDQSNPHADYGLTFYPELILTPSRTVSLVLRSVVSPIDRSALTSAGMNWNVFGGFNMVAFAGVQTGDDAAVFSWKRPGAATLTTGFTYSF